MLVRLLAIVVAAVACAAPPVAQTAARSSPTARDTVDRVVAARMDSLHIAGLSLAVVRAGKVVKAEGYGVGDRGVATAAAAARSFEIAWPISCPPLVSIARRQGSMPSISICERR